MNIFFVCSRGAPVLAKDMNLRIQGILSNNSLCLTFNMTLTTRNVSIGTNSFIYNLPQGVKLVPPHGICNGGHILVILQLSPHMQDEHVLF